MTYPNRLGCRYNHESMIDADNVINISNIRVNLPFTNYTRPIPRSTQVIVQRIFQRILLDCKLLGKIRLDIWIIISINLGITI